MTNEPLSAFDIMLILFHHHKKGTLKEQQSIQHGKHKHGKHKHKQ